MSIVNIIGIGIGVCFLLLMFVGSVICAIHERKEYNNGVCQCGKGTFEHRDTDSQGGNLWRCTTCGKQIWTSWI